MLWHCMSKLNPTTLFFNSIEVLFKKIKMKNMLIPKKTFFFLKVCFVVSLFNSTGHQKNSKFTSEDIF